MEISRAILHAERSGRGTPAKHGFTLVPSLELDRTYTIHAFQCNHIHATYHQNFVEISRAILHAERSGRGTPAKQCFTLVPSLELDHTYTIHVLTCNHILAQHITILCMRSQGLSSTRSAVDGAPWRSMLHSSALPLSQSCTHHHFTLVYEISRVFATQVAVGGTPRQGKFGPSVLP